MAYDISNSNVVGPGAGQALKDTQALPGFGRPRDVYFGTVSGQVAGLIRRDIQSGVLRPGARLRQREIAERFKISTTPVREAFQALQAEGFLRAHPHRGAIVVEPSADDIREAYAIRKALEGLAVAEAIRHITSEDRKFLQALLDRMEEAQEREVWARLDQEFHLCIYQLAAMPRLVSMVAQLRAAFTYYLEGAYDDAGRRNEALEDHRRILQACLSGDDVAARAAVADHLEHTARVVTDSLMATADRVEFSPIMIRDERTTR